MEEESSESESELEIGYKESVSGVLELKVESEASEVDAKLKNIISDEDEDRGDGVVLAENWWESLDWHFQYCTSINYMRVHMSERVEGCQHGRFHP